MSAGKCAGSRILRTVPGLTCDCSDLEINQQTHVSQAFPHQVPDPLYSSHLSNSATLDNLVDAYFTCYNTSYPILHEISFRQKYQNRHQLPARSSWHLIFYIVLAIGNWVTGGNAGPGQCQYYSAARSRMSMSMLESGTLLTVQAFLLVVSLHRDNNNHLFCTNKDLGELHPKAGSAKHWIQFYWNSISDGAGAGASP